MSGVDNLYDTRAKSFDAGDVVGEDTHVTSGGGEVDLNHIGRGEDGLNVHDRGERRAQVVLHVVTYLVGKDQGELDFVRGLSIAATASGECPGCTPGQRRGETKRRHCDECSVLSGPAEFLELSSGKRRVAESARVKPR